jgi:hypothetical protein
MSPEQLHSTKANPFSRGSYSKRLIRNEHGTPKGVRNFRTLVIYKHLTPPE